MFSMKTLLPKNVKYRCLFSLLTVHSTDRQGIFCLSPIIFSTCHKKDKINNFLNVSCQIICCSFVYAVFVFRLSHMSRGMRKPTPYICENKGVY